MTAQAGRLGTPALIAIQDSTAGIVVRLGDTTPRPAVGTWLEVTGALSDPYGQLEVRGLTAIRATGPAGLPVPIAVDGGSLGEAAEGRLVTVEGIADGRPTKATSGDLTFVDHDRARSRSGSQPTLRPGCPPARWRLAIDFGSPALRASVRAARARPTAIGSGSAARPISSGWAARRRPPARHRHRRPRRARRSEPSPRRSWPAAARSRSRDRSRRPGPSSTRPGAASSSRIGLPRSRSCCQSERPRRRSARTSASAARSVERTVPRGSGRSRSGATERTRSVRSSCGSHPARRTNGASCAFAATWSRSTSPATAGPPSSGSVARGSRSRGWPAPGSRSSALKEGRTATIVGIVRRPYPSASDRRFAIVPRSARDLTIGGTADDHSGQARLRRLRDERARSEHGARCRWECRRRRERSARRRSRQPGRPRRAGRPGRWPRPGSRRDRVPTGRRDGGGPGPAACRGRGPCRLGGRR